jgi:hypothetical protein
VRLGGGKDPSGDQLMHSLLRLFQRSENYFPPRRGKAAGARPDAPTRDCPRGRQRALSGSERPLYDSAGLRERTIVASPTPLADSPSTAVLKRRAAAKIGAASPLLMGCSRPIRIARWAQTTQRLAIAHLAVANSGLSALTCPDNPTWPMKTTIDRIRPGSRDLFLWSVGYLTDG